MPQFKTVGEVIDHCDLDNVFEQAVHNEVLSLAGLDAIRTTLTTTEHGKLAADTVYQGKDMLTHLRHTIGKNDEYSQLLDWIVEIVSTYIARSPAETTSKRYSSFLREREPERGDRPEDFKGCVDWLDKGATDDGPYDLFIQALKTIPNADALLFAYWHSTVLPELMKEFDSDGEIGEIGDLLGQELERYLED